MCQQGVRAGFLRSVSVIKVCLPMAAPEGWALLFAEVRTRLQELHSPWPLTELGSQWAQRGGAQGDVLGSEGWIQVSFPCAQYHWRWGMGSKLPAQGSPACSRTEWKLSSFLEGKPGEQRASTGTPLSWGWACQKKGPSMVESPQGKALFLSIHKQTRALPSQGRLWGPSKITKRSLESDSCLLQSKAKDGSVGTQENILIHEKCSELFHSFRHLARSSVAVPSPAGLDQHSQHGVTAWSHSPLGLQSITASLGPCEEHGEVAGSTRPAQRRDGERSDRS